MGNLTVHLGVQCSPISLWGIPIMSGMVQTAQIMVILICEAALSISIWDEIVLRSVKLIFVSSEHTTEGSVELIILSSEHPTEWPT